MAYNESIGHADANKKEVANKTESCTLLSDSFDDETDSFQFPVKSGKELIVDVSIYEFTKPIKRFDMNVSYDSPEDFFQDLGFNNVTISRLRPHFSTLKNFVDYDVFAIIERLEADMIANEDSLNERSMESQQDFFESLRLFGFQDEWAQTYTWAMGKAYANQLVKHSIEECFRLRLSSSNTIQPYPDWTADLQINQWQTYNNPEFREGENFFVRKQDRCGLLDFDQHIKDINFANLTNLAHPNHANPQYWFHATDWNGAKSILRSGITGHGENTDFARGSAYYLNNNYHDCYEFLFQRNHKFLGKHAIFIYEFDPEQLSNGQYLCIDQETHPNIKRWQQLVFSCMNISQDEVSDLHKCRCVFGWQCANAIEIRHRRATRNTPRRRTRPFDGQYAQQLAIRSNRMWPQVDDHLIGVVIFEHL